MKSKLQRTDNVESSINTGDLSDHHKEQKKKRHLCHAGKNTIPLSIGATIQQYNRERRVWWEGRKALSVARSSHARQMGANKDAWSETYAKKSPVSSSQWPQNKSTEDDF